MNRKYDAYVIEGGKVLVYPRGELGDCGCLPDGRPLHESTEDGDWWEWCDSRSSRADDSIRLCRRVGKFNAAYVDDLRRRAQDLLDAYRREGAAAGWGELAIDHSGMHYTFRSSAAWKDEPILYTFDQPFKWPRYHEGDWDCAALRIRDRLVQLYGMADAAHELGLDIVFDKSFVVRVMGASFAWSATYE